MAERQTRTVQIRVLARVWGFKSPLAHVKNGYIDLRGHKTWSVDYQTSGEPLLLLHGGLSCTEDWESYVLPSVEDRFHIYAYDRTGHGRTGIRDGYFHFDFQAEEAIAYIEDVIKEPTHLVGWSDGGIISLLVAIKRPDLVKSMVAIGTNYHWDTGGHFDPNAPIIIPDEDKEKWLARSPDPLEQMEKTIRLGFKIWSSEPNMTLDDLAKIQCPTLVLNGDDEPFDAEHGVSLYKALKDGRLAIIPAASHYVMREQPELFKEAIRQFHSHLEYPVTKWPRHRRKPE